MLDVNARLWSHLMPRVCDNLYWATILALEEAVDADGFFTVKVTVSDLAPDSLMPFHTSEPLDLSEVRVRLGV